MTCKRTLTHGASRLATAFVLASIGLAGCNQNTSNVNSAPPPLAALPMTNDVAPPIEPAPSASALPAAPAARLGSLSNPSDRYAFADRAYAANSGFGDAPPDYTFQYRGGERPWVWRGDDQSTRVAEPLPGGGYRYYYYDPGASQPYLVRDPDYSYGYDGGALVVVYDNRGRPVAPGMMQRQADIAGRYLYWAAAIYAASQQQQREAVAEANWAAQRSAIDAERAQWEADQAANQDWAAYHAAHQQEEDAHWDAERYQREAEAVRFDITINDTQAAQRDTQAARQAQSRAVAAGQPVGQPRAGYAPPPAAPAAPVAAQPPRPYPAAQIAAAPPRPHPNTLVAAAQPLRPHPAAPVAAEPPRPYIGAPAATVRSQPARSYPAAGVGMAPSRPGPAVRPPGHGENAAAQAAAARAAAAQNAAAAARANGQAKLASEQAVRNARQATPAAAIRPPATPAARPQAQTARPAVKTPPAATSPAAKHPKPPHAETPGADDHHRPDHP